MDNDQGLRLVQDDGPAPLRTGRPQNEAKAGEDF
jgi:hypothetical protein